MSSLQGASYRVVTFIVLAAAVMLVSGPAWGNIVITGSTTPVYGGMGDWWIDGELIVGDGADGSLTINSGSRVDVNDNPAFVGDYEAGGTGGLVLVTGAGSTLAVDGELFVGPLAQGSLSIESGAVVTAGDAVIAGSPVLDAFDQVIGVVPGMGAVTVSGGSQWDMSPWGWLTVGASGTGSLTIGTAGEVITDTTVIGMAPDGVGSVIVDDASSTLTATNDLVVGAWGEGSLTISEGGQVQSGRGWVGGVDTGVVNFEDPVFGTFGAQAGAGDAVVTGGNSRWDIDGNLVVGAWGTGDMTIESQAQVTVGGVGFIGGMVPFVPEGPVTIDMFGTGTGSMLVTGNGSSLTILGDENLFVGFSGTGTLDVAAGGDVVAPALVIGAGPDVGGTVTVSGAGSTLAADYEVLVGAWGNGELTVSNAGSLTTEEVLIGGFDSSDVDDLPPEILAAFGPAVGPGMVTVTGASSTLDAAEHIYVGNYGNGTLNVSLGGTVTAGEIAVGVAPGSDGIVNVAGGTLEADDGHGVEEPGYVPGVMIVGGYGQGDVLVAGGGDLIADEALFIGGYPPTDLDFDTVPIGYDPDGPGVVTVMDAGSTLTTRGLVVGFNGQGTLNILNDADVTSTVAYVGALADAQGEVLVDNTVGTWVNTESVAVGAYGEGLVTIRNGGHVDVNDVVYIGGYETDEFGGDTLGYAFDPNGTGTVTVTGAESLLEAMGIAVGVEGDGTLEILNGAEVQAEAAVVGLGTNGIGEVRVDGLGSTWRIDSADVGNEAPDALGQGLVDISNGGQVIVNGTGILNVADLIRVGSDGEGTLTVSGGGSVTADSVDIGGTDPLFDTLEEYFAPGVVFTEGAGAATVTGAGSNLNVEYLMVGFAGSGTLDVDNGAALTSNAAFLGAVPGSTGIMEVNNTSTWNAGDEVVVGLWGQGDLTIAGGSDVTTGTMYIGGASFDVVDPEGGPHDPALMPDGTGVVTVTGLGSTLMVAQPVTFYVGYHGTGTLNILNGGEVWTDVAVVGASPDAVGTVDVNDGTLTSEWATVVGAWGQGNMIVSNGGSVTTDTMFIGGFDASQPGPFSELVEELGDPNGTGVVTVTGEGSSLNIADVTTLVVGAGGTGSLNVLAGGDVTSDETFIGGFLTFEDTGEGELVHMFGGTGAAAVNGTGSTFQNDILVVGTDGVGTMDVLGGGTVTSYLGVVGLGPNASGSVVVSGAGSWWQNTEGIGDPEDPFNGTLIVGGWGQGDLLVSGGGRVDAVTAYIGGFDIIELGDVTTDWGLDDPAGTGTVTVTGAESLLDVEGLDTIHVGYTGQGTLNILDGGEVTSDSASIGTVEGSSGTATVGANGVWSNSGPLFVGNAGNGELLVEEGGEVSATDVMIGFVPNSTGLVEVTGLYSNMMVTNNLTVGYYTSGPGGTGTLLVNDGGNVQVGNELWVSPTGLVGGDGTISVAEATTLHNYGTIAPGDEGIGTLTVYGPVIFHSGSTYAVEIANDNTSDLLQVGGGVDIQGGTVQVDSQGTIIGEHHYEIIDAYFVTGTFDVLDTALLNFTVTDANLSYDESSVWLHLTAANFNDPNLAWTYNQRQVAGALQVISGEEGDDPITDELQDLPLPEDVRDAYDDLSGQTRPPLSSLTAAGTSKFLGTVASRMQTVQTGLVNSFTAPGLLAMTGPDSTMDGARTIDAYPRGQTFSAGQGSSVLGQMPWGVWGRAYGLYGDRENDFEAPGYGYDMLGFSVGLDYQFSEVWLAGLVVGTADGDVDFAQSRDNTDFKAKYVGLYGSATWGKWYFDSVATLANLSYDTERFVDLLGERLTGSFDGLEIAGYTEFGRKWQLAPDLLLQPLVSLQYSYLSLDDYTEQGGSSALSFKKQTHDSLKGSLGARLTKSLIETMGDFRASVQVRGRWVHEFADDQASVDTFFATHPAAVFTVRDAEVTRDSAVVGVGFFGDLNKHTRAYVDYDTRFSSDETVHVIGASLQYRW